MMIYHCQTDCNINPAEATPKAIMRTMGVKGLTLFHLKSHLQVHAVVHASMSCNFISATSLLSLLLISTYQKYRLGRQSGKELTEQSKDGKLQISTDDILNFHATPFLAVCYSFINILTAVSILVCMSSIVKTLIPQILLWNAQLPLICHSVCYTMTCITRKAYLFKDMVVR